MRATRFLILGLALCLGAVQGCHKKGGGGYLRVAPVHAR
jgi:hypothetical protein